MHPIPPDHDDMLAMPETVEKLLWELAFWYEAGRHDADDHRQGQGSWPDIYARLMLATNGRCGENMTALYEAWQNDEMNEFIAGGAPTAELMLAAQAAYEEAMQL